MNRKPLTALERSVLKEIESYQEPDPIARRVVDLVIAFAWGFFVAFLVYGGH